MVGFKFEKFGRDYGWKFISIAIDVTISNVTLSVAQNSGVSPTSVESG
jgi:hypothetical protein